MKKSWIHSGTILIRVGQHHLAFLRAYLEGLDLGMIATRYLETSTEPDPDLRVAKSTLKWIRDQLMVAAHRTGRFPNARLILINPSKLAVTPQKHLPTLDEFREDRDPHEMYTETELIEMFQDEFGGESGKVDRKSQRNERLRKKQISALFYFESLLGANPSLSDSVHGWIDPALARRLSNAELNTLEDVISYINIHGFRWWKNIPRFGEKAAAQVVAWLKTEIVQKSLGISLSIHALISDTQLRAMGTENLRKKSFGMAPLEFIALPGEFDGTAGENRDYRNQIKARNDLDAIYEWLRLKTEGSNTWRSYRKEAERFLIWSVLERKKALSSTLVEDCAAYKEWLLKFDPQRGSIANNWPFNMPREAWISPRGSDRWSPVWRPFEGALTEKSIHQAIVIVAGLFKWLNDVQYIKFNPWNAVKIKTAGGSTKPDRKRSFTKFQWKYILNFLEAMPHDCKYDRLRFCLIFSYGTGLRLSELVSAKIEDLKPVFDIDGSDYGKWQLAVVGKGNQLRHVPMPSKVLNELQRYLDKRGLVDRFTCSPDTYLIGRLVPLKESPPPEYNEVVEVKSPKFSEITPNALYQTFKGFFGAVADSLEKQGDDIKDSYSNPELAASYLHMATQLNKASTHWLRHTCGSHAVAAGVSLQTVQTNFGHSSIDTTTIYVTPEDGKRVDEMDMLMEATFG